MIVLPLLYFQIRQLAAPHLHAYMCSCVQHMQMHAYSFVLSRVLSSDRKIEIPMPNESARIDILKIHSSKIAKTGDIG